MKKHPLLTLLETVFRKKVKVTSIKSSNSGAEASLEISTPEKTICFQVDIVNEQKGHFYFVEPPNTRRQRRKPLSTLLHILYYLLAYFSIELL